ncbi:hypothetical protein HDU93_001890 [Gonapodya sp. JEL0774]|nr:hypothetical protein HDU93_001890 [Gonapodya sp. JEL0774]
MPPTTCFWRPLSIHHCIWWNQLFGRSHLSGISGGQTARFASSSFPKPASGAHSPSHAHPSDGHVSPIAASPTLTPSPRLSVQPPSVPTRIKVKLNESEIQESFVKGSGPGGQKINKCRHRVQLIHVPTGIRADSQASRSLAVNRSIARKLLLAKLDEAINGAVSKKQTKIDKERKRKAKKCRETKAKYGGGGAGGGRSGNKNLAERTLAETDHGVVSSQLDHDHSLVEGDEALTDEDVDPERTWDAEYGMTDSETDEEIDPIADMEDLDSDYEYELDTSNTISGGEWLHYVDKTDSGENRSKVGKEYTEGDFLRDNDGVHVDALRGKHTGGGDG